LIANGIKGIALLKDQPQQRALQTWIGTLERHYAERTLPIELETSTTLKPPERFASIHGMIRMN